MSFSIGQQVGQYRIESRIGQGGMATVYKAHHKDLDRHVAIKVMHVALSEDASFLERFRREAQIVGRLSHPHIIPIYDFATVENQPYLVMKYVEGETLKQRMRRQPLTLDEVTEVLDAVASALDYAHQNDVLHRDVKPSNVMLDSRGTPFLTDFGLARVASLGESTLSADVMLGTPQYISPEQARGVRQLDAGTDIYSLGVVLYELVVGRVPFTSDTPYTIIHDHIYKPLPMPTYVNPGVPHSVEQVLLKVLAKERLQRYNTAGELAVAFRKAVNQGNMIEISLRTMRPEAFDDQVASSAPQPVTPYPQAQPVAQQMPMQQPVIPSPMMQSGMMQSGMTPSGNVVVPGSSVNYRVQTASGNGWVITGCLLFIVTCLISAGVLLNAMNDDRFQRTWSDAQSQANAADDEIVFDDTAIDALTADVLLFNAQSDTLKQEQVTLYQENYPNDAGGKLAQAYLLLNADDAPRALLEIRQVIQDEDSDPLVMLAWAELFAEDGYDEPALYLFVSAYSEGFDNPDIRNTAGEYLYNQVSSLRGPSVLSICALYDQIPETPQLNMITAQAFISAQNAFSVPYVRPSDQDTDSATDRGLPNQELCSELGVDSIEALIDKALDMDRDMAELYLVKGNYYEAEGVLDEARINWRLALSYEDAPAWVTSKADAKLNSQN